jgi:hypothetical protein
MIWVGQDLDGAELLEKRRPQCREGDHLGVGLNPSGREKQNQMLQHFQQLKLYPQRFLKIPTI